MKVVTDKQELKSILAEKGITVLDVQDIVSSEEMIKRQDLVRVDSYDEYTGIVAVTCGFERYGITSAETPKFFKKYTVYV